MTYKIQRGFPCPKLNVFMEILQVFQRCEPNSEKMPYLAKFVESMKKFLDLDLDADEVENLISSSLSTDLFGKISMM